MATCTRVKVGGIGFESPQLHLFFNPRNPVVETGLKLASLLVKHTARPADRFTCKQAIKLARSKHFHMPNEPILNIFNVEYNIQSVFFYCFSGSPCGACIHRRSSQMHGFRLTTISIQFGLKSSQKKGLSFTVVNK